MAPVTDELGESGFLGPLIRERLTELIAEDIAAAVRKWQPGQAGEAVISEVTGTAYARFLAEAASEIWKELQGYV